MTDDDFYLALDPGAYDVVASLDDLCQHIREVAAPEAPATEGQ
ncbi:hypothetical protein ACPC54_18050 [Kitasatospora sp. NPDC094028]